MGKNFWLLDIVGDYTGNGLPREKYKPRGWRFFFEVQSIVESCEEMDYRSDEKRKKVKKFVIFLLFVYLAFANK